MLWKNIIHWVAIALTFNCFTCLLYNIDVLPGKPAEKNEINNYYFAKYVVSLPDSHSFE